MNLPSVLGLKTAAIASAASLTMGLVGGWVLHDRLVYEPHLVKEAKAVSKAQVRVAKVEAGGQAVSQVLRDQGDTKQATIRTVYKNIIEKVPVYVPVPERARSEASEGDGALSLPLGAIRLHDYAALGLDPPVPAPSGEPVSAPSGIELPAFVTTVAGNYGVCRGYREEVMTWREWYQRESAAWGTPK